MGVLFNLKVIAMSFIPTKRNQLLIAFFIYSNICVAQFQKTTPFSSAATALINNNGQILHGTRNDNTKRILSKFELNGDLIWSKRLLPFEDEGLLREVRFVFHSQFHDNGDFTFVDVLRPNKKKFIFSKINSIGEVDFAKLFKYPSNLEPFFFTGDTKISRSLAFETGENILINYLTDTLNSSLIYSFLKTNEKGKIIWHKEFEDLLPSTPIVFANNIGLNRFALIRNGLHNSTSEEPQVANIIQIYDKDFTEIKTLQIEGNIQNIIYKNNNYYIAIDSYKGSEDQSISNNLIVCLDSSFEFVWGKEYTEATSNKSRYTFFETEFGFLMSEYIAIDPFVNLITLDTQGNILRSIKLATTNSVLPPNVSASYFVHEGTFRDSNGFQKQLTCASNTLDNLSCYALESCYSVVEYEVEINEPNSFYLKPIDNINIEESDALLQTVNNEINYLDNCNEDFGNFASPIFDSPDTICINQNIQITNLQNEDADSVDWLTPNASIEFSSIASPPAFSYPNKGVYIITQQITFEGCTNEYSKEIVVIAPIDLAVETDITLCDQDPYLIDAGHELALAHLWQDSTTNSEILTNNEGVYNLQLTDQYCTQSIDFNLTYFDYSQIEPNFPEDTLICSQIALPLGDSLSPNVSTLWDDGSATYPRLVSKEGFYILTTSLEGCSTESSVYIETEDCITQMFMPNIFSPNRDGINDEIYPLGDSFEILQFTILDRWGSLIHDEASPWDGTFRNKEASMGVYSYSLNLLNLRLNTRESYSGNFTLVR